MNKLAYKYYEKDCDKCCGSGKVLDKGIWELIVHWRRRLGLSARTLAALASIPYTSYCKFENARLVFSEARLRTIIQLLEVYKEENAKQ